MLGTALAILSAGTTAYSLGKSAIENKKTENMLKQRKNELDLEYKLDYNADYLNTPEAQSTLELLRKKYVDTAKKYAQGAVIGGQSMEGQIAATEKIATPYSDAVTKLAGYGTQYKQMVKNRWLMNQSHIQDLIFRNQEGKQQNWMNLGSNALAAGIGFAEADAMGAFDKMDKGIVNAFNKKKVKAPNMSLKSLPITD